jgi:hypothetical protein
MNIEKAPSRGNIVVAETEKRMRFGKDGRDLDGVVDLGGPKTEEDMCRELIKTIIGPHKPQYVEPLYNFFANHPDKFDFFEPGILRVLPDGFFIKLERQIGPDPVKRGYYLYEWVTVTLTWDDVEKMMKAGEI